MLTFSWAAILAWLLAFARSHWHLALILCVGAFVGAKWHFRGATVAEYLLAGLVAIGFAKAKVEEFVSWLVGQIAMPIPEDK